MIVAFTGEDEGVRMRLRTEELDLLRRLRDELSGVLDEGIVPGDAVHERLFPPTVTDDPDADLELRGLVHDDLRRERLEALGELLAILDRAETDGRTRTVLLVDEEPHVVLGVLNDLRLALGARVGIQHLADRLDVPEEARGAVAVMDYLAMWQEQLLAALDPASLEHYDHHDPDDE